MAGAKPTFEELYREFLPRIYAYVRVQVGSTADAEDVTSEVFIHAYEAYGRYEPQASTPAAWLFRIARNASLDHHRRSGRRDRLRQILARQPTATEDPAEVAEDRLRHAELLDAVAGLSEGQREAISLRHVGLAFAEVGALLGCSEDAAKMLYHRGVRSLKNAVRRKEEGA